MHPQMTFHAHSADIIMARLILQFIVLMSHMPVDWAQ